MSLIIGVLGRPKTIDRDITTLSKSITDVIINYGHIPLGIIAPVTDINKPMTEKEKNNLYLAIDLCDGIILQGGTDYYQYDMEAIKYIYEKDIPLLGICLGMQSIGVYFGAEMDFIDNHNKIGEDYAHPVDINEQSKLFKIFGTNNIIVNSRHKEMIINPTNIKVVGYADDVIEAIEKSDALFLIGVQWHPEDMISYDVSSRALFENFFASCKVYSSTKKEI